MGKVVPLLSATNLEFDCGDEQLNNWFKKRAVASESAGFSRVYVMQAGEENVGFYSLNAAAVDLEPAALSQPGAAGPLAALLLSRLAVSAKHQGVGVGQRLVADAIARGSLIARRVGAQVLLVHPKPEAAGFFLKQGFTRMGSNDSLFLVLKAKA